ncbi:MAG: proline dehydrogenase family protein [Ignavibacteria bacterium]
MLQSLIAASLPYIPKSIVKSVASRYIAGSTLEEAVRTVQLLAQKGASSTIDVLGEFVSTKERALHEFSSSKEVLNAIQQYGLPAYLSVKPTSLGLGIDPDFAYQQIRTLVEMARTFGAFVRMDMENSPYTTQTIDMYKKLRHEGFDNCGIVIQAYLYRSESDILSLLDLDPNIRLCKGIYRESPEIAYTNPDDIRNNYKKLLRLLLKHASKTGIATHDDILINDAMQVIASDAIPTNNYEFQMLLGVREERRDAILKAGHQMRIYVPFGEDWYGYSTRRLKENPQVAGYVFKAMFRKG